MPAATSAPNAMSRMISVIGTESVPRLAEILPERAVIAFGALASPISPMKKPGWAR